MEKNLQYQHTGPLKGYRLVKTKNALNYASTVYSSKNPPQPGSLKKLKVSLPLGEHDGGLRPLSMKRLLNSFFTALSISSYVEVLDLSDCAVNDEIMETYVAKMMQRNTSIIELNLHNNTLTAKGVKALFRGLSARRKDTELFLLKKLDLGGNALLSAATGEALTGKDVQFTMWGLETLSLKHSKDIGANGIRQMLNSLQRIDASALHTLDLSGVLLGDDGAAHIANTLFCEVTAELRTLLLSDCGIKEYGVKAIGVKLQSVNTVKKLDLSKNHVGDGALGHLSQLIVESTALKELNLKQCSISVSGFTGFLNKLWAAYENNGTSFLETLNISKNGLGDETIPLLTDVLNHNNCSIKTIKYDQNNVTNSGATKWAKFLKAQKARKRTELTEKVPENWLQQLTLKGNNISADGVWEIAEALKKNRDKLYHLDLRDNDVGKSGVKYLRSFLMGANKSMQELEKTDKQFVLAVYPKDVGGAAGINELLVASRSGAVSNRTANKEEDGKIVLAGNDRFILRRVLYNEAARTELDGYYSELPDKIVEKQGKYKIPYPKCILRREDLHYVLEGWNETRTEDELKQLYLEIVYENYRGEFLWHPKIWGVVKKGYGTVVANAIYRYAMILRYETYQLHKKEKARRLKEMTNRGWSHEKAVAKIEAREPERNLVTEFWELVVKQRCPKSEGMTMFEFLIHYNQGPSIDILRQFAFLYLSQESKALKGTERVPFILTSLASGAGSKTVQEICAASKDPAVRRWASTKKLVGGRYDTIEVVHKSREVWIVKAEDLFHTYELDEDRFFYVRTFPRGFGEELVDKDILAMRNREVEAYESLEYKAGEMVKNSGRKLGDVIHLRQNGLTMARHYHMTVPTLSGEAAVYNHASEVVVWKPYVKTLRQALDDEGLAGGRNLTKIRHVAMCVAYSLLALNVRSSWLDRMKEEDKKKLNKIAHTNRIHGNLKPRNIVLSDLGNVMAELDAELPEKWVLIDFTRSLKHKEKVDASFFGDSAYMPPEIARRQFTYDVNVSKNIEASEKIDVWAYGCVLFELTAGVSLFLMEQREDALLNKRERAELVNWIKLDEERKDLILRDLPPTPENDELRKHAVNLISWCLNGDPANRPSITEVRDHPFLRFSYKQKTSKAASWIDTNVLSTKKSKGAAAKIAAQSHLHLVNTGFEEALPVVHSLEESLHSLGCRITTDQITPKNSWKEIEHNCKTARIVLCLLSADCFTDAAVVKQLVWAHQAYLAASAKSTLSTMADVKSVTFLNITNNKGPRAWKSSTFTSGKTWATSDKFQYLVTQLAADKTVELLSAADSSYSSPLSTVISVLRTQYHPLFCSMLKQTMQYRSESFLRKRLLTDLLVQGNLQPLPSIKPFEAPRLKQRNFAKKIEDPLKTSENKAAFFMPEKLQVRYYPHRVMVLEPGVQHEFVSEAVGEITSGLQSYVEVNYDKDGNDLQYNLFRERSNDNPFTKVLNANKVKKGSLKYFPATPRITALDKVYDFVFSEKIQEGKLVVVAIIDKGFWKKYGQLLEAFEQRRGHDLVIVPVYLSMSKTWENEYDILMQKLSPALKERLQEKHTYIPYFKKADNSEHLACLAHIGEVARALTKRKVPVATA